MRQPRCCSAGGETISLNLRVGSYDIARRRGVGGRDGCRVRRGGGGLISVVLLFQRVVIVGKRYNTRMLS